MLHELYETARLLVRKPIEADAAGIFDAYARDAEVTRYLAWKPHASADATIGFLRETIDTWGRDRFPFSIVSKDGGGIIGMLEIRIEGHKANLGYVLAKAFWRRGLMAEALAPVMQALFANGSIARVWAVCDVENRGSARVMEKIGMEREGILRRWLIHPNRSDFPRDCYVYSKVK